MIHVLQNSLQSFKMASNSGLIWNKAVLSDDKPRKIWTAYESEKKCRYSKLCQLFYYFAILIKAIIMIYFISYNQF